VDPQNELTPDLAARIARLESMLSPDGTVRCQRLVIMDAHGTARIVASVSPSGDALLEWLDSGQVRRMAVAARADGTAAIVASDSRGRTRIAIGTNEDGESHLACVDAAGRPRITMGTSGGVPVPAAGGAGAGADAAGGKAAEAPTSAAAISLIDEGGATRIALLSSKGDAVLNMSDAQRRVRIVSGTFADGSVAVPGMTG
jgi:hypothetical protein